MEFNVVRTNIVNIAADAIILPANEQLKEGSGASRAIFEAAGRKNLTKECEKEKPCDIGSAIPTRAFDLNAKYIIHAVVPRWVDGEHNEYNLLCSAYLTALNIAECLGCTTVAFPLLAAGNNGFDKELAYQIAYECFTSFDAVKLKQITLVIFEDEVEAIVKEKGFSVIRIPDDLSKKQAQFEHKKKAEKVKNDLKEIALDLLQNEIDQAKAWLSDPKHKKMVFDLSIHIVQIAASKCMRVKSPITLPIKLLKKK